MDALSIILLVLLLAALLGACMGKWGQAPLILTIVAVLVLVIQKVVH